MKLNKFLFGLTLFLTIGVFNSCKEKQKVELQLNENHLVIGEKVENIKITEFISNVPNNEDFDTKYLVIDFWATWCAPCLATVPHFNDLQKHFENNSEISFISLTDETPKIVKRILDRIEFKTIVATDQSKETLKKYKVNSLPTTIIIDKKNTVRWIGTPKELNKDIINNIINDQSWKPRSKIDKNSPQKNKHTGTSTALNDLSNSKSNVYSFNIAYAEKSEPKLNNFSLPSGKYIDLNNDLKSILSKVTRKPLSEIIIPSNFKDKNYNLLYINTNLKKEKFDMNLFLKQLQIIENKLLSALELKKKVEVQKTDVFVLKAQDKSKLEIGSGELMAHTGDNDKYLTFSNVDIDLLMKNVSKFHNVVLINETNLNGKYEFLIDKNDFEKAKEDLLSYGISVEKAKRDVEFYIYEKL